MIKTIETSPFDDQKPGTSGLRKKVSAFRQPHYVENFIQSIFDVQPGFSGGILVLGGDGRFYNDVVIQTVIRMAAANGFGRVIVGRKGILSTPAASNLIRQLGASGGIILSASHNPGGPQGDFGIKYNGANGGPASEKLSEAIYQRSRVIDRYMTVATPPVDLDREGTLEIAGMSVEVIDPVAAYANLMEKLFDFDAIRDLLMSGYRIAFDAMHAVTGPYAEEIFVNRLGAAPEAVMNSTPLPDFGGHHPDPNLTHAKALHAIMMDADGPDFGAASDGDGDRNLILGRGVFVNPSDSLAILAANAHLVPAYSDGIVGIARSMPTSRAADRVAEKLEVSLYETPTGWKFFGNLLDAGRVTICGEESAGTGSDHVREKDGLWAVLFWLNILSVRRRSVAEIVADHWECFGRHYYARHDYEAVESQAAESLIVELAARIDTLPGEIFEGHMVEKADDFAYDDPVDGSQSAHQGIRVFLSGGRRIVYRLSGTGTSGATLRVYIEHCEDDVARQHMEPNEALSEIAAIARKIARIEHHTGRTEPSLIT